MEDKKILLKDLILSASQQLRQDFMEIQENNPHAAESGAETEIILKAFLKERLPRRFDVETGFVVGSDGSVSKQCDLIIYDAINCPIYRKGPKTYIFPKDNVAAVIEVKSKINKDELNDAGRKIESVKKIKPSPITNVDQPVTFSDMIMTNTLGCVFAFDSYTTLKTLSENLKEINSKYESQYWIDSVAILDKGVIGYTMQAPFNENMIGWFGGACVDEFPIPPYYIHLVKQESGDLALNHFFMKLMTHLTFFRKRSSVDFASVLGSDPKQIMTIQGYQFNLEKKLVPAEKSHYKGKFVNPKIRFNLYSKSTRDLIGQVCLLPWQDGATITCSASFNPKVIFQHYFHTLKLKGIFVSAEKDVNMWFSSVLPIKDEEFIKASEQIHKDIISVRDTDDDEPPPTKI